MGWITDLIKEYPALSVVKQRLALIQEQYNKLERKNSKLERENERLQRENRKLKEQLENLQSERAGDLEDVESNIVRLLGSKNGLELLATGVADELGLSRPKVEYYLNRLVENEYVDTQCIAGEEPAYSLAQKGREYLVRNDFI